MRLTQPTIDENGYDNNPYYTPNIPVKMLITHCTDIPGALSFIDGAPKRLLRLEELNEYEQDDRYITKKFISEI